MDKSFLADAIGQFLVNTLGEDAEWVLCYRRTPTNKTNVVSTMTPQDLIGIFEAQVAALRAGKISPLTTHEADDETLTH